MRTKRQKNRKKLTEMKNEFSRLLSEEQPHLQYHLLNKVVQMTHSEYGFISKPLNKSEYKLDVIARTNAVTEEAEHRCITDCLVNDKVFDGGTIYISNKTVKRYPSIKRFAAFPIILKEDVVFFVVLCNSLTPYKKKTIVPAQDFVEEFSYIFTNSIFQ